MTQNAEDGVIARYYMGKKWNTYTHTETNKHVSIILRLDPLQSVNLFVGIETALISFNRRL